MNAVDRIEISSEKQEEEENKMGKEGSSHWEMLSSKQLFKIPR